MDALKSSIAELSQKEQDELMLFILQNRSGKKSKSTKEKNPDAPKREMSDAQKAWTDTIKMVQAVVNREVPTDTAFKYKQAMTVASAIKKAGVEVNDKTVVSFYKKLKEEGLPSPSESEAEKPAEAAKPVKKAKKVKVEKDE